MSRLKIAASCLALFAPLASAAPFDPNNLAVLRIGTGAAALSSACTAVFIDEYDVFGTLQQSIALPTATVGDQRRFCLSGTATSEGMLTRSADGSVLLVGGYDAALGTASVSSAAGIPRVVAVIRQDGSIDTSTVFTDGFSTSNFRGVASDDGTRFWLSGTGTGGGVRYIAALGATTSALVSSTITNTRVVEVFEDEFGPRLYVSSQSGAFRLSSVGSGLPTTSGQALSNLPGLPTATTSPYQYLLADYDFGVSGFDVLYVANDDATGVQKWSSVGGTWVSNGSIGVAADSYRGIAQYADSLYVTGRASGVGVIRRIDDFTGYNGALSGTATTLVTASANRVFQGIALTPDPPPPPAVTVADVSVVEGNPPGTTTMTFTATLAQAIADDCDFSVETFDSSPDATATPNVDYTPISLELSIPAGDTSVTFDVPIIRDTDIEADEVLVIDVYGEPQACDIFGIDTVLGTIIDDDAVGPPDISINDIALFEGDAGSTQATLTVSLSAPAPAGGVTVNYSTADGSASTTLTDYTATSGTLTFVAGDDSETITVDLTGDTHFEADETLFVNLSDAVGGNLLDAQGQITILNDDDLPTLTIDSPSINEGTPPGATTLVFSVTASNSPAPGESISVDYASSGGTAASGIDFTAVGGTLTFTHGGALTLPISVPITRDNVDEDDESFTVALSNASNAGIYIGVGAGTIIDDDTAVVSIDSVTQAEGDSGTSSFGFTVSLSVPAASVREFVVHTSDLTATAGSDYVGIPVVPGQLVQFPPLNISQPVVVTVNGDTDVEPDESFEVRVSPVAGAIEGGPPVLATGIGTILNDDVQIDVAINDTSVTEGTGAGTTTALFTVSLSAQPPAGSPLTVNYATAGGSATSGVDFSATAGALTFSNGGALTQTVSVPITRDNIDENDESFVVDITAPTANVTDAQGAGTILDDDTAIVSVSSPSQNEGNSGQSPMLFTVSLSTPSASTLTYVAFTGNGTAIAPGDYIAIPPSATQVTFVPGDVTESVAVQIVGDNVVEPDETLVLNLSDQLPTIEGGPTIIAFGTGTIVNDDVLVDVSINDVSVVEGTGAGSSNAVFTVTLSAQPAPGAPVTVNYATAGGSATSGTDFTATSGALTFTNGGALTQTISVPITRDNIDENDEGFVVDISAPTANVTDAQGAGTILDDDNPPTPSIANVQVTEGNAGSVAATFTVTLSNPSAFAINYQASTADGTAVAPGDYQAISGGSNNVAFAPLQTSQTISVDVLGELLVEANESFVLELRSAGAPTVLASASGTINNDDSATLSIAGSSGPEGNAGLTPRQFTATLSNPVQAQVQVSYATADGSATLADNDYQAVSGTLTFPGSSTTQTLDVNVVGDIEVEPDQSFVVNLSGLNAPAGVTLGTTSATGTIVNDDATSFSIAAASVTEGSGSNSTLSFTVSLSAPAKDPVSVQYTTVDGSALAPADYLAANGTVTFNGGQTTQTIAVSVIGDSLVEPDETLQVQLGNPIGGSIANGTATGSIINDDFAVLSINDVTLPEGSGNGTTAFVFEICSSNPSTMPITVNYQTGNGSAQAPTDYLFASGTATIPALATCVTVSVTVIADNVVEPDETFSVTLSDAQGATIGDPVGIGTILGDDDLIPVPTLDPRSLALLLALMLAIGMIGIARRH